jgi:CRISPR-associated endonuclease/helicase Cas3
MASIDFNAAFQTITGNTPFPWQQRLYQEFLKGSFPEVCKVPTGLGKTRVILIWLLALANEPMLIPRRLVYVVNRRTVVDQTTTEVENLRRKLAGLPKHIQGLMVSTLRGQLADNREWHSDPSQPAVICGTVDLIGSALLFSSYRVGRGTRPLHAGFLGQDVLLIHDEAHLESAFQKLVEVIRDEQAKDGSSGVKPFRLMALTATPRTTDKPFALDEKDFANSIVDQRINAKKTLRFHGIGDKKKETAESLFRLANAHENSGKAILIFARSVNDAKEIYRKLDVSYPARTALLVGPLRGFERDKLVGDPKFTRFLPAENRKIGASPTEGTVYLVCTSAGEVGVNISADHMVCDLTPYDSMAQRLGRVNRFGIGAALVDIVYPAAFEDDAYGIACSQTLNLLRRLSKCDADAYSGSPAALEELPVQDRINAASPKPPELDATDILFDAWALTSIRDLPGRPPVEQYLHGVEKADDADTFFAWREEVSLLNLVPDLPEDELRGKRQTITDYLDEYGLEPHELLREKTYNARSHLKDIAKRVGNQSAWIINVDGKLAVSLVQDLAAMDPRELAGQTIVLPEAAGGLRGGILDGKTPYSANVKYDVADAFPDEGRPRRVRYIWSYSKNTQSGDDEESTDPGVWKRIGLWEGTPIQPPIDENETDHHGMARLNDIPLGLDKEENVRRFVAFVRRDSAGDETRSRFAKKEQSLDAHHERAEQVAMNFAKDIFLEGDFREAIRLAAKWHDLGKDRRIWQSGISNFGYPCQVLAKSNQSRRIQGLEGYRHEFGSLLDLENEPEFKAIKSENQKELIRHLIAVHHGFGRPHFPTEKAFDTERSETEAKKIAAEVPLRFARLQRKYGRWGLAYLESLLRAVDWYASEHPSKEEKS